MAYLLNTIKRAYRGLHNRLYLNTSFASKSVRLGEDVYIAPGSVLNAKEVAIGDGTRINGPIRIHGFQSVRIGKYCAFGSRITMISSNHVMRHANLQGTLHRRFGFVSLMNDDVRPIIIGHNVWIGDNATVLPGVEVGSGAVIGASSVVTKDIPPFAVAAGVPARCISNRFDDSMIAALLEIRWWDWPLDKIAGNRSFFEADLTSISTSELRSVIVKS